MNEQATAFIEAVKADEALQAKLKAAVSADEVVALAASLGITLSADDVAEAPVDGADISDEDLEAASGGTMGWTRFLCFGSAGACWV